MQLLLLHAKMLRRICSAKWVASPGTRGTLTAQPTSVASSKLSGLLSPLPYPTLSLSFLPPSHVNRAHSGVKMRLFLRCPLAEKGIKSPLDCQHLLPFCAFCSASASSSFRFCAPSAPVSLPQSPCAFPYCSPYCNICNCLRHLDFFYFYFVLILLLIVLLILLLILCLLPSSFFLLRSTFYILPSTFCLNLLHSTSSFFLLSYNYYNLPSTLTFYLLPRPFSFYFYILYQAVFLLPSSY